MGKGVVALSRRVGVLLIVMGLLALVLTARLAFSPAPAPTPSAEPQAQVENHLPGTEADPVALELPEQKSDVITLEGMAETFAFTRFNAENLGFVIYIPEDMVAETVSSDEGDGVVVNSNFQGNKRDDVYLSYFLFTEGVTLEEATQQTKTMLTSQGAEFPEPLEPEASPYPWALEDFSFVKQEGGSPYIGFVGFGNRGQRVLRVMTHLPEEFAEGVYPRVEKILADTQWYISE